MDFTFWPLRGMRAQDTLTSRILKLSSAMKTALLSVAALKSANPRSSAAATASLAPSKAESKEELKRDLKIDSCSSVSNYINVLSQWKFEEVGPLPIHPWSCA